MIEQPFPLIVLLDSGPLGLVTNPNASPETIQCLAWMEGLLSSGHRVIVPEIIDYEIRRELLRAGKTRGLGKLDDLKARVDYLPLSTEAMLQAAQFWAQVRQVGLPTADRLALDADVILAAQAATLNVKAWEMPGAAVVVATVNVGHLSRFVTAKEWPEIA